jgi:hypothetical protein
MAFETAPDWAGCRAYNRLRPWTRNGRKNTRRWGEEPRLCGGRISSEVDSRWRAASGNHRLWPRRACGEGVCLGDCKTAMAINRRGEREAFGFELKRGHPGQGACAGGNPSERQLSVVKRQWGGEAPLLTTPSCAPMRAVESWIARPSAGCGSLGLRQAPFPPLRRRAGPNRSQNGRDNCRWSEACRKDRSRSPARNLQTTRRTLILTRRARRCISNLGWMVD